jgi:hypothetical protein
MIKFSKNMAILKENSSNIGILMYAAPTKFHTVCVDNLCFVFISGREKVVHTYSVERGWNSIH